MNRDEGTGRIRVRKLDLPSFNQIHVGVCVERDLRIPLHETPYREVNRATQIALSMVGADVRISASRETLLAPLRVYFFRFREIDRSHRIAIRTICRTINATR